MGRPDHGSLNTKELMWTVPGSVRGLTPHWTSACVTSDRFHRKSCFSAVQSILMVCLTTWYGNSSSQDWIVRTCTAIPSLQSLCNSRWVSRARRRVKDPHHTSNGSEPWTINNKLLKLNIYLRTFTIYDTILYILSPPYLHCSPLTWPFFYCVHFVHFLVYLASIGIFSSRIL